MSSRDNHTTGQPAAQLAPGAGRLSASCLPGETITLSHERDEQGLTTSLVRRTVLPGGLRVLTEQLAGVRSANAAVFINVGSRHESAEQHGCSHFLEHLLFKGTGERSAMDISSLMDTLGGDFNAYTAKEYTCFHGRVLDEDLEVCLDLLGDMLTSATLLAEDVEAERQVILDEIAMHEDDPDDVVHNLLTGLAWGESGLGRPIAGTEASITALGRDDIVSFYREHYTAAAMTLVVAGNVRHEQVLDWVSTAFGRGDFLAKNLSPDLPVAALEPWPVQSGESGVERDLEQINLLLGMPGITRTDPRRYALSLLITILGGGSSSRLFQQVREERGLAYSVFAFASHYSDAGLIGISVGCLPERVEEVLTLIRTICSDVATHGVSEVELSRAQSQLRGGLILGMEDPGARVSRLGKAELFYDELLSTDEIISRVQAVTVTELQELAAQLLTDQRLLAQVGPLAS